jgi:UDP-N-acetylmuramoyl-tripeptide--D-alanyl-D-alanine ligase
VIPLRIEQIAQAVRGTVHGVDGTTIVRSVVTDSRETVADAMFVAISGERVDGHTFASDVISRGACVVLSDRVLAEPCIQVANTVTALGALAQWYHRTQLQCTVIAITGSSGKTTTKDLIHHVCEQAGPTVSARGSFNTDVGLPLTVLEADAETRYLVLEMGMRGS